MTSTQLFRKAQLNAELDAAWRAKDVSRMQAALSALTSLRRSVYG